MEIVTADLMFGPLRFTSHTSAEAVELVVANCERVDASPMSVVTPNIQHVYLAETDALLARAVNAADVILPDGWPLAAALRHFYSDQRGRVAGSDLTEFVLRAAHASDLSVAILGGSAASNQMAVQRTRARFPGLAVDGSSELRLPDAPTITSRAAFTSQVNGFAADITLVCFGAPKSELHVAACRDDVKTGALLCVGATVDFLAGTKKRAPRWVQKAGLEWAFRLVQEPRRLTARYVRGAISFTSAWRRTARSTRRSA